MARELISKRTRIAFREVLVDFVLREIDDFFAGAGLQPNNEHVPNVGGQRRTLVEQYYANIDFTSTIEVRKVLSVYSEIISSLEREHASPLLRRLERDGFVFGEDRKLRAIPARHNPLVGTLDDLARHLDYPRLADHVDLLVNSVESNPSLAVGTSKELVETVCKTILVERGMDPGRDSLGKLVRLTAKELSLLPGSIPNEARGVKTIRRLLNNLAQVSDGLAELRNLYGTGHGRAGRRAGVRPRHARLAVGAATTLATFLLETHRNRGCPDPPGME